MTAAGLMTAGNNGIDIFSLINLYGIRLACKLSVQERGEYVNLYYV